MKVDLVKKDKTEEITYLNESLYEFLTMKVNSQVFGIPVGSVRDVLIVQEITKVPLAPPQVIGMINLRGKIITALDIRAILKMTSIEDFKNGMSVVVEYEEELYSLVVDSVGDVIRIPLSKIIQNPENLAKNWLSVSIGIFPIKNELIVIVDINKLLQNLNVEEKL